ncbi:hypothetical protein Tco_0007228 [Tanacetum coccineum]
MRRINRTMALDREIERPAPSEGYEITSMMKFPERPEYVGYVYLFPFFHRGSSPDMELDKVRETLTGGNHQISNPKEDLKGITTRSGVAYQGPTSSSSPKVMNRDTEVTKDTMLPTNNGSTEDVQPPVIQVQSQNPTSEPVVDPVSAPMAYIQTNHPIPFPSRRNDERRREKANDQIEKFYEIFRDLSFEISFTDALTLMPKFASTLKTLIGNKEKLSA